MKRALSLVVLVLAGLLFGCSARAPAKSATLGAIDAFRETDDQLVQEIRVLVKKYVEGALRAGPPKPIEQVSAEITAGVLSELGRHAPAVRPVVAGVVREAVLAGTSAAGEAIAPLEPALKRTAEGIGDGLFAGLARHDGAFLELIRRTSAEAGGSLAQAAADRVFAELEQRLGQNADGTLSRTIGGAVRKTSAAAVEGASDQLDQEAPECTEKDVKKCPQNLVRRLSRWVAVGAAEGVGTKIQLWHVIAAFALGIGLALAAGWAARNIRRRRAPAG